MTASPLQKLREYSEVTNNNEPDHFLFCNADGSRLGNTWWLKHFGTAMMNLNIDRESRNLKSHSFRHMLNTHLISEGVEPMLIRAMTGWRNASVQDGYTHLWVEPLSGTIKKMDQIWGAGEGASKPQ
jgi:site-specific recombinase XerD